MEIAEFILKVKSRLWGILVQRTRYKRIYPFIYRSYWHYLFHKKNKDINNTCYFTAQPNIGAGIGHQLANWNAGYWYAKKNGLMFAHTPFPKKEWDEFLGFGENEKKIYELKKNGYKIRKLPFFRENNERDKELIKSIIRSYVGERIVFLAEQDQPYKDQYGVLDDIKHKFRNASARKDSKLIYSTNNYNIAVHIRRGDIVIGQENRNPNLIMRWLDNSYFENILSVVIENIKTEKLKEIYLFSQGERKDFAEFDKFNNMHFLLDLDPKESFLHMVYADLLITSKSSFSYKPALLNRGIKICPRNFWHGYPDKPDWILAEDNGAFNVDDLLCYFQNINLDATKYD